MPSSRRHSGFTLADLFVAIGVIGLLLGLALLLLPAIHSGGGRRDTCSNNMRIIGICIMHFEVNKLSYPGYANVVRDKRATWVVPLLTYMERNDLYQLWQNTDPVELPLPAGSSGTKLGPGRLNPWAHAPISLLTCPSSQFHDESNPLSYVVNCGSARGAFDFSSDALAPSTWVEDINSGVFFNHARADLDTNITQPNPNPPRDSFAPEDGPVMTLKFISDHDGAAYTILLSENLNATNWVTDATDTQHSPTSPFQSEFQIKRDTGFVWFVTGNKDNTLPPSPSALKAHPFDPRPLLINQAKATRRPANAGLEMSRPSSEHPGGVNVLFSDGHLRFIAEEMDYKVYTQLMTTNGAQAVVADEPRIITTTDAGWTYRLNESDY